MRRSFIFDGKTHQDCSSQSRKSQTWAQESASHRLRVLGSFFYESSQKVLDLGPTSMKSEGSRTMLGAVKWLETSTGTDSYNFL